MRFAPIDYMKGRWGWRWIPLAVAVFILVCTGLYAWLRPELYRSETRILVEPRTAFDHELSAAEAKENVEDQIQNLQWMLESRTVRQQIIEEFRLRSSDTSVPLEDALKALRDNVQILKTSGNIFAMAYYATSPQAAQAITKRLAEILVHRCQSALQAKAMEKHEFLSEELNMAQKELELVDMRIAQIPSTHAAEPSAYVERQGLLREQARSQRRLDEIDHMRLNAQMAARLIKDGHNDRMLILDVASLPERPEFPSRYDILGMGFILALAAALPAVLMRKKVPGDTA